VIREERGPPGVGPFRGRNLRWHPLVRATLLFTHVKGPSTMAEASSPDRIPLTIAVTPSQKRAIERLAEQEGVSPAAVVEAALDRELTAAASNGDETKVEAQPGSFLEAVSDLAGSVDSPEAPSDLSINPDHMEGYGRS